MVSTQEKIVRDFLGQEININDYVCYPGGGNTKAEYGLLLLKIVSIKDDSLRIERLDVDYGQGRGRKILRKQSTIKAFSKIVKVKPSQKMIEVFEKPEDHFDLVGAWIHGRTDIDWETLAVGKMRD